MAYRLTCITIRTNNTPEGMSRIDDLWRDVTDGKLPVLFDSEHHFQQGISPVSTYSNYASDESGDYDLSILGVTSDFFRPAFFFILPLQMVISPLPLLRFFSNPVKIALATDAKENSHETADRTIPGL